MNTNRRGFLSAALGSSAVVSLGTSAPQFLLQAAAAPAQSTEETVLVVLQLSGGNDGLNTVVPYRDDSYRQNRPTLGIGAGQVLKVDDELGFHPAMRGFSDLMEASKLSVIHGVGYPNPNRSHFESMDIWHTCYRKDQTRPDGWLGRYLDRSPSRGRDVPALHLGGEKQPFALAAREVRVPSVRSLDRFRLQSGSNRQLRKAIEDLASGQRAAENELLSFVQSSTASALRASERVEKASKGYQTSVQYPTTELASKLRTVAQLIDAGLTTRIYYLALDGFDTHSRQAAAHAGLLGRFSGAVKAFMDDVAEHGHAERVLLMSFSEFGRRLKENASQGTDHGAAAPMFLAGGRVQPGFVGQQPSLTDLQDGDVKFHTDFRRVYASILEDWLAVDSQPILGGQFETLPIVRG